MSENQTAEEQQGVPANPLAKSAFGDWADAAKYQPDCVITVATLAGAACTSIWAPPEFATHCWHYVFAGFVLVVNGAVKVALSSREQRMAKKEIDVSARFRRAQVLKSEVNRKAKIKPPNGRRA